MADVVQLDHEAPTVTPETLAAGKVTMTHAEYVAWVEAGRPGFVNLAEEAEHELLAADTLTTDELQSVIWKAGRNYGAEFLDEACEAGKISAETVTALVGQIWSMCEFPDRQLDHDTWRWLFDIAGFTVDGKPAPRPTEPIVLWRGSVPERRTDWSWSTDRTVAEKYAFGSMNFRPIGRLYTVTAPPEALLCANNGRDEAEYVVDTRGLTIREAS